MPPKHKKFKHRKPQRKGKRKENRKRIKNPRRKWQKKKEKLMPADVRMISGCRDSQTSSDVTNVSAFGLPDPAGLAGGACTSALLKVLYADHHKVEEDLSFVQVLESMREYLGDTGYEQVPQLSSNKPIDVSTPFHLVPEGATGKRRALLIGINYVGHEQGQLSGCINDALNMKEYIMDVHGFEEEDITLLFDDGEHDPPTRDNIINAYKKLVEEAEAGDAIFCHYSGHGGKVRDDEDEEDDGYDETLVPVDYQQSGMIRDDDLFDTLVHPMPDGVTLTCLMDCCHSGTVLDLPYKFQADGEQTVIELDDDFDFGAVLASLGLDDDDDDDEDEEEEE